MTDRHSSRKRHRSRSSTPSLEHHENQTRKSSRRSTTKRLPPPNPITSDDFFAKSLEFKFWLKNEKGKFVDQLDSSKTKKYFEKFLRHWNKGKLDKDYYNPPEHWRTSSGLTSSHSWTFKETTVLEREKAKRALEEARIGPLSLVNSSATKSNQIIGPTLPPQSTVTTSSYLPMNLADHQYKLDQERDSNYDERIRNKNELNKKRKEEREEENSNKATGKDRLLEKRLEKRQAMNEYQRERDDPSLEIDDRNLFGSSNSFQEAIRARNKAQERRKGKNSTFKMEKQLIMQEKMSAMKSKESETMAMFKALANSKFGQSSSHS